jgi:hypothetical protein
MKKNDACKWDLGSLDNSMAAFGRDIRFIFKHHALEYMGPTNEMDVTPGGKKGRFFLNWQFVHHPHRNVLEVAALGSSAKIKLMILPQRNNYVDLTNITLILQESSELLLPRVIESITLGNKSRRIIFGCKNKLLGQK